MSSADTVRGQGRCDYIKMCNKFVYSYIRAQIIIQEGRVTIVIITLTGDYFVEGGWKREHWPLVTSSKCNNFKKWVSSKK